MSGFRFTTEVPGHRELADQLEGTELAVRHTIEGEKGAASSAMNKLRTIGEYVAAQYVLFYGKRPTPNYGDMLSILCDEARFPRQMWHVLKDIQKYGNMGSHGGLSNDQDYLFIVPGLAQRLDVEVLRQLAEDIPVLLGLDGKPAEPGPRPGQRVQTARVVPEAPREPEPAPARRTVTVKKRAIPVPRKPVSAGWFGSIGVKSDGTVTGNFPDGGLTKELASWQKMVAVDSFAHILGLRSDGRVLAAGDNSRGQCQVASWEKIVDVAAGVLHSLGLRYDGRVVAAGDDRWGQCKVEAWRNVISVSAGTVHSLGLRSDGTVAAAGDRSRGQCAVEAWQGIRAIAAGGLHSLGLRSDGTVVAVGDNSQGQCEVSSWRNIVAVAAGEKHSLGLRADGTVVSAGANRNDQCNVKSWHHVVALSAGSRHSLGLRADGVVYSVGLEPCCREVSSWRGIRVPR